MTQVLLIIKIKFHQDNNSWIQMGNVEQIYQPYVIIKENIDLYSRIYFIQTFNIFSLHIILSLGTG